MMKRMIALMLALVLACSFAACGETPQNNPDTTKDTTGTPDITKATEPDEPEATTEPEPTVEITPDTWGVTDRTSAENGTTRLYYINFPESRGFGAGAGLASQQSDGTVSIVSGQNELCDPVNDLSEVFPAFYPDLELNLRGFYGLFSDNFEYVLNSNEAVTINDKEMHKFTGTISFDDPDDQHKDCSYVAYAVQLESNEAYAYWLVLDDSGEVAPEKLAEYAYNMALTFREDQ